MVGCWIKLVTLRVVGGALLVDTRLQYTTPSGSDENYSLLKSHSSSARGECIVRIKPKVKKGSARPTGRRGLTYFYDQHPTWVSLRM
jgi:hypothetical protein